MQYNQKYYNIEKSGYLFAGLIGFIIFVDILSSVSTSKIIHLTDTIQFPMSVPIVVMIYPVLDIIAELFGKKAYVFAVFSRIFVSILFVIMCFIQYNLRKRYQICHTYIYSLLLLPKY
tara:strand:- start:387 stop:740 length:354 start_codon:yes stop_codon:yes gene_type:complete